MAERLTRQQMAEKYPSRWLGLVDVEYEEDGANVKSGIVKYPVITEDDVTLMAIKGEVYPIYTTPNDCLSMGAIGIYMGMLEMEEIEFTIT